MTRMPRTPSVANWIVRKRIQIVEKKPHCLVSPHIFERGGFVPTKEQLRKRVQELEEENDQLQDQLDQIYDIVAPREQQGERDNSGKD